MPLGDTGLHCAPCPLDFPTLSLARLQEHGEQHDPAASGAVVRDPRLLATEVEAQLPELPAELSSEGFVEMHAFVGEQVDVPLRLTEQLIEEREELCLDLLFELDRTPKP
jgi:hypothetical protein